MRGLAVIAGKEIRVDSLIRALKAAGAGANVIMAGEATAALSRFEEEPPTAVFTTVALLEETLKAIGERPWRVFVLNDRPEEDVFVTTLKDERIGGLIAWDAKGGRPWELRYIARRLLAPSEPPPHMGALLGWGATTVLVRPSTTADQRGTVSRIEVMGKRLGLTRRLCRSLSTAAHELTMNAMYDAPIDSSGNLKYALHRAAEISLLPEEVPSLRFTLSARYIALDVVDPFGRLPRARFYEGVLRGHRNLKYQRNDMDTSHGGAGLGLHTLYSGGSILRAEIFPGQLTHVSWILDRKASVMGFRDMPRSLYFMKAQAI